jgi:hypothetical protein
MLSENSYHLASTGFSIECSEWFGANIGGKTIFYHPGNGENAELSVTPASQLPVHVVITEWISNVRRWKINSTGICNITVSGLDPCKSYQLEVDGTPIQSFTSYANGNITFDYNCKASANFSLTE